MFFRGPRVFWALAHVFQRTKDSGSWLMFSEDLGFLDLSSCFSEDQGFFGLWLMFSDDQRFWILTHVFRGPRIFGSWLMFFRGLRGFWALAHVFKGPKVLDPGSCF